MRARLRGEFGETFPDFTEETEPTKGQIELLIPQGVGRIVSAIGVSICEGDDQAPLYESAKALAALYTACLAERSYFPDQVSSQRSPYTAIYEEFKDGIKVLVESVAEHCGGSSDGAGESVGGAGQMPRSCFPPPSGIGRSEW